MAMMLLKDRCTIRRTEKGDKSPTGAVKMVPKIVVEHWPCYIEDDDGVVVVPQEGQTAISYHTMFVELGTDIQTNDVVIDEATGHKYKVLDCNHYRILPHLEVKMQYGTVK
jgi:hypothetical protein